MWTFIKNLLSVIDKVLSFFHTRGIKKDGANEQVSKQIKEDKRKDDQARDSINRVNSDHSLRERLLNVIKRNSSN